MYQCMYVLMNFKKSVNFSNILIREYNDRAHAQPIAQDMWQNLILPDGINVSNMFHHWCHCLCLFFFFFFVLHMLIGIYHI